MIWTNPQQLDYYSATVAELGPRPVDFVERALAHSKRQARTHLALLKRLGAGSRFLDFGCGTGALVDEAVRFGFDAHGHDLNASVIQAGNRHWKFDRLHSDPLNSFLASQPSWDVIIANQVFEHMQRPVEVGAMLAQHLAPGGLLFIDVPYVNQPGEWKQLGSTLDPTAHWSHFSLKTLRGLMKRLELNVVFSSAAPACTGIWERLTTPEQAARLGATCRRILPPIGTGACVVGRRSQR
jgi:2-polyprenyl-3-methyl-5-hydroxy-6-metoxy-1,4-benzoquinol methylase